MSALPPQTLRQAVESIDPLLLPHLGSIYLMLHPDGVTAWLGIHLMVDGQCARTPSGDVITIDASSLPDGVNVTARVRWPEIERQITLAVPLTDQLRELEDSGLVGGLDTARIDHGPGQTPRYTWIVKTHAGDAERQRWALR